LETKEGGKGGKGGRKSVGEKKAEMMLEMRNNLGGGQRNSRSRKNSARNVSIADLPRIEGLTTEQVKA
jgi:hypothetical protein